MSLIKQNTSKNKQVDKNVIKLDAGNTKSKEYKLEAICNSIVNIK